MRDLAVLAKMTSLGQKAKAQGGLAELAKRTSFGQKAKAQERQGYQSKSPDFLASEETTKEELKEEAVVHAASCIVKGCYALAEPSVATKNPWNQK